MERSIQLVLEALSSNLCTLHHFGAGGVTGYIAEKCLLKTMKDEHCLVGTVNNFRRGRVTINWAI